MKNKLKYFLAALVLLSFVLINKSTVRAATTIYDNETGTQDGYDYELWKDSGTTSMTLNSGGTFSCQWSDINNALFRKGKKFDCTQTYQQIGDISINYGVDYQPSGNSYLCAYGWCKDPLVEYYIVESWGTWRPPGATSKGQITVDGGTYDVYETTRVDQPSIEGNTTFKQYWSVRTSEKTSGTISVTDHFKAWENLGMEMGNIYEVALNVEGYQSSGYANVYKNEISIGSSSSSDSSSQSSDSSSSSSSSNGTVIECENMTLSGSYAGKISSPFSGVALYENNDSVSTTQYFAYDTHDFTLRGASSSSSNMAQVDLYIGGEKKGTFYYGDNYTADYTIENVSHGTGSQEIKLVVSADDGNWDAYIDSLTISSSDSSSSTSTQTGTTTSNKLVALTFDDGPSSTTSDVLDVLEDYDVKATFFLIGQQVNSSTMSIMQRQVSMGCELASHSYTHQDMSQMSATEIKNEMEWTRSAIKNTVDYDISFFRPPYLSTSNTMYENIDYPFIQGITCNDWVDSTSASERTSTVLNNVSDGTIVLLHDFQGNSETVQALPGIIEGLKAQGYTFVTVSELFAQKGVNPNVEYKIWSKVG